MQDAVINTCNLLIKLGFSAHPDKSQFLPLKKIRVLRIYFRSSSMTVSLTGLQHKIKPLISETLQSKKNKIRQMAKFLGTYEASLPAIKFEALKLKKGNYEGLINLTENCITEL